MLIWKNDQEPYALIKQELFTALVGDVLDKMGYINQFLPPEIKPINPDMVVIGRLCRFWKQMFLATLL